MMSPSSARAAGAALIVALAVSSSSPTRADPVTRFDIVTFANTGQARNGVLWKPGIVALNAANEPEDCFAHRVSFSDPGSVLMPPVHQYGNDSHFLFCPVAGAIDMEFGLIPLKAGQHQLTVTDLDDPSVTSVIRFEVAPGPANRLELTPPKPVVSLGDFVPFTLVARDAYGYQAADDFRKLTVVSTDSTPGALMPAEAALAGGSATFAVRFGATGRQSVKVTAADTSGLTATATVNVVPAPHFELQVQPPPITAGVPASIVVCVRNANGSVNTGYRGTATWVGSDVNAEYPIDDEFGATQQGCITETVTFARAGMQTVTVRDTVSANIAGSAAVNVLGGDAVHLEFAAVPSTITAGPLAVIVNVTDEWGNPASNAHLSFTCDDPSPDAVMPPDFTFRMRDNGSRQFQFTLPTAPRFTTCTATSTFGGASFSTGFSVNVLPDAGNGHFYVSEVETPRAAGRPGDVRVTVADGYGNRIASYRGRIHFTSSDPQARLPADYSFTAADAGSHLFQGGVVLRTPGRQSLAVTDVATRSLTGRQDRIAVNRSRPGLISGKSAPRPAMADVSARR